MCILDRVKLAELFPTTLNICFSFSPPDNLLHKVDVLPCQGGESMGWPSFSPLPKKQQLHKCLYS